MKLNLDTANKYRIIKRVEDLTLDAQVTIDKMFMSGPVSIDIASQSTQATLFKFKKTLIKYLVENL